MNISVSHLGSASKGGARLYIMSGMSREVAQERGGWKSAGLEERVYFKARPERVVPGIHAALGAERVPAWGSRSLRKRSSATPPWWREAKWVFFGGPTRGSGFDDPVLSRGHSHRIS